MGAACAVMRLALVVVDRIARMKIRHQFAVSPPSTVKFSITGEPIRVAGNETVLVILEQLTPKKGRKNKLMNRDATRASEKDPQ
jgi:hypothetical protein